MGDKTGIEWTDATWNPVSGCDRTSPGCDNCYALKMAARLKKMGSANYQNDGDHRTSGPGFGVTCHPHMLDQPLRWKKPRRIFVNSMSDLFHPAVPLDFICDVFGVMADESRHTYQVLTKRPRRMAAFHRYVAEYRGGHVGNYGSTLPLPNVWLGTSIESDRYTFRAHHLRATPAAVRFISAEPLLGPLPSLDLTGIDWLIVGGESGPGARPMHPDWVRDLRDQCCRPIEHPCAGRCIGCGAGVDEACYPPCKCSDGEDCAASKALRYPKFFFKQWGEWAPGMPDARTVGLTGKTPQGGHPHIWLDWDGKRRDTNELSTFTRPSDWAGMLRVGKHAADRDLDGRTWDEMP